MKSVTNALTYKVQNCRSNVRFNARQTCVVLREFIRIIVWKKMFLTFFFRSPFFHPLFLSPFFSSVRYSHDRICKINGLCTTIRINPTMFHFHRWGEGGWNTIFRFHGRLKNRGEKLRADVEVANYARNVGIQRQLDGPDNWIIQCETATF